MSQRTYTTAEASDLTGLTVRALRKRIERGQLNAVRIDGRWKLPHSELARHDLLQDAEPAATATIREMAERLGQQQQEIVQLRLLERRASAERQEMQAELVRTRAEGEAERARAADLERELTAARARADEQLTAARTRADELAQWRDRLAAASWWERRRLLRSARLGELEPA